MQHAENETLNNGRVAAQKEVLESHLAAPKPLVDFGLATVFDLAKPTETQCTLNSPSDNQIATLHLMSGETIERVSFASKVETTRICDRTGFSGIVLIGENGNTCLVREANVKMVTWHETSRDLPVATKTKRVSKAPNQDPNRV